MMHASDAGMLKDVVFALWIVSIACGALYAIAGNIALFLIMKSRGSGLSSFLAGLALIAYFTDEPKVRSPGLDRFALSVMVSLMWMVANVLIIITTTL